MVYPKYKKQVVLILVLIAVMLIFLPRLNYIKNINDNNTHVSTTPSFDWSDTTILNNGTDEGRDLVLDPSGNIYVTGKIYNESKDADDVILVKYNSDGEIQWNKTWGGYSDDEGYAIDIDSLNNLYIVGKTKSYGTNDSYDICLLKYDSDGILDWNHSWGESEKDTGHGIAIYSNSIYIVGFTKMNLDFGDAVILKYTTSGVYEWNKTWGESEADGAYDVGVDSSENVYVTGYTEEVGTKNRDLFLAIYDSDGNSISNRTWGDETESDDYSSLTIGSDGVFIVGNILKIGTGGSDIILSKFALGTGTPLWTTTWGGDDNEYGYDIALNSNEDIHVVGALETLDKSSSVLIVARFSNSGEFKRYNTYSNGYKDVGFGILMDSNNFEYCTGKTTSNDTGYDIFLLKNPPYPSEFDLSSDTSSLDADGTFTLSWTESIDADNYSVYQSNNYITQIDGSVSHLEIGNTNRTHLVTNLAEGPYYFMVVAFNIYGNTSSNNLHVTVQYPPGNFVLDQPDPPFNTDGIITLSWASSINADNYSIYRSTTSITDYKVSGILMNEGLENTSCTVAEEVEDGTHFFIVVAFNEAGDTSSNCITIIVQKLPGSFVLSTEVPSGTVDEDGVFFLSWTRSQFADLYVVYTSSTPLNESGAIIEEYDNYTIDFDDPEYRYQVNTSESGTHYFQVLAFNSNGNFSSGIVSVEVKIPLPIPEFQFGPELIILIIVIVSVLGASSVLTYRYIKNKRKEEEPTIE